MAKTVTEFYESLSPDERRTLADACGLEVRELTRLINLASRPRHDRLWRFIDASGGKVTFSAAMRHWWAREAKTPRERLEAADVDRR